MDAQDIERALGSPDPEERRLATARIPAHPAERIVDALVRALGDPDWRVRKEAVSAALTLAPSEVVLGRLVEIIRPEETDVGLRNAAVEALAAYGPACVDALSVALPHLDADGRKLAAEALGLTGNSGALIVLETLTYDPDPNVRATALEQVALLGATCVDRVAPQLERYLDHPDPLLRMTALNGLNDLGVALPWSVVQPLLRDPLLRAPALMSASRTGAPEATTVLLELLFESRGAARRHALIALARHIRSGEECAAAARLGLGGITAEQRRSLLERALPTNEDQDARKAAVVLLGVIGGKEAAQLAAVALTDERVETEAEEALSLLGPEAVAALVVLSRSEDVEARTRALELAGELADPAMAPAVAKAALEALSSPSHELVVAALDALALVGGEDALVPTAGFLAATDSRLRRSAVDTLRTLARRLPDAAIALVSAARPESPDAHAAAIVMAALDRPAHSEEADIDFLSRALANSGARVRRAAVDALARYGSERAVEAVAFALTDEEPSVSSAALRALGRMRRADGSAAGVEPLLELVRRGAPREVLAEAARALGDAGDGQALRVLQELVENGGPMVAVSAIEALAQLNHPDRTAALLSCLEHDDSEIVKAAMQRLAEHSDPLVRSHLVAALVHQAWDVRRLAADLLGTIGGEATIARLRQSLLHESEELVRQAMQRALVELETRHSSIRRSMLPTLTKGSLRG
jgi:HEAT repeat protein